MSIPEANEERGIVIPFVPRKPQAPAIHTAKLAADERLATALQTLDSSLANQREAIEKWRTSLVALKTAMAKLEDGLRNFHDELAAIDTKKGNPTPP